jgi:hypothetical protein
MADGPKPTFTEQIPSIAGRVSAIGSASAPFIFVDEFPVSGFYNGIAHITCEAMRFHSLGPPPTGVEIDRVTVAHLRMNLSALLALKGAIAQIERVMERVGVTYPPPAEPKPAE